MAFLEKKNNAESLTTDNPLAIAATTVNVTSGEGSKFPSSGDFMLTIWDAVTYPDPGDDSNMEIVRATARSTDAITITRAQEGTADVEHAQGSAIGMLITAGTLDEALDQDVKTSDSVEFASVTDGTATLTGGELTGVGLESVDIHSDVDTVSDAPATNEVLKWNGSNWVPAAYNATFAFSIASFTDNESSTQLIGTGTWKTTGNITFNATYTNGPATSATIALVSNGGVTWTVNPLVMTTPYATISSTQDTAYPNGKDKYISFTLTGNKTTESGTSSAAVYFRNLIYWGPSTTGSGFTEANVEALIGSAISNDNTRAMSIFPGASDYLVFAFPSTYTSIPYGADYETDGTSGFLYNGITCAFRAPEIVSLTNSAGFTENYKVYASYEQDLGSGTLLTKTSSSQINPLYYGVTSTASGYTESDIEGLANSEVTNGNTQVWDSVTAGSGEYMLFSFPKRLGIPTFWVGGFEGGFESPETVSVTNFNGWSEDYYVWRSTNSNLGATVVETKA